MTDVTLVRLWLNAGYPGIDGMDSFSITQALYSVGVPLPECVRASMLRQPDLLRHPDFIRACEPHEYERLLREHGLRKECTIDG